MKKKNLNFHVVSSLDNTTSAYLKVKKKYSQNMLKHIMSFSKNGKVIAEVGPGLGHFASECKNRGLDYIGFEPSTLLRKELLKEDINVIDAFVPPIPLEEKKCDVIYASMILEHLPTYNEAAHFASEVARVLKDDGYVCLVVPNYLTCREFFFEMDYTHSFVTTKRRVRNLLHDNGIEVIDVQHVIGWFWVKSNILLNAMRHLINILMVSLHWRLTTWCAYYLGLETLLWKIRKSFFESLIIIGIKK